MCVIIPLKTPRGMVILYTIKEGKCEFESPIAGCVGVSIEPLLGE